MKDQTVVAEDSYGNGNNNDNNSLGEEGGARYKTLGKVVIPVVNRMQDIFTHLGSASMIDLPHMAVVGSQSNGKSSVLEALIGCDFLPSGSNIYTPRPLVLQLVQSVHQSEEATEWGEFLHLPGKCFTDFSSICKEIQVYEKGRSYEDVQDFSWQVRISQGNGSLLPKP